MAVRVNFENSAIWMSIGLAACPLIRNAKAPVAGSRLPSAAIRITFVSGFVDLNLTERWPACQASPSRIAAFATMPAAANGAGSANAGASDTPVPLKLAPSSASAWSPVTIAASADGV